MQSFQRTTQSFVYWYFLWFLSFTLDVAKHETACNTKCDSLHQWIWFSTNCVNYKDAVSAKYSENLSLIKWPLLLKICCYTCRLVILEGCCIKKGTNSLSDPEVDLLVTSWPGTRSQFVASWEEASVAKKRDHNRSWQLPKHVCLIWFVCVIFSF